MEIFFTLKIAKKISPFIMENLGQIGSMTVFLSITLFFWSILLILHVKGTITIPWSMILEVLASLSETPILYF